MISAEPVPNASDAVTVRLLDTQARSHIRHRLLHRKADGELVEDSIWSWSSPPHRYLDTALYMAAASDPKVDLVDTSDAPTLAVTLIAFHVESTRLVAAVELRIKDREQRLKTQVVKVEEPVDSELPGNLAVAAGDLLLRLATNCLASVGEVS
jgi:hypothetical protein